MARQVKCKGCGEKIDKDNAFLHVHVTKGGTEQKMYYCNEKEYIEIEREKEFYRLSQYSSDEVLGRPITNNVRNKEFKEVHDAGYTWEQIYLYMESNKDNIKGLILSKGIDQEYQQIRFMCQCLKNGIYDFVKQLDNKSEWDKLIEKQEQEEIIEEEYKPTDFKVKRKGLF